MFFLKLNRFGDKIAFIDKDRVYTYEEIEEEINSFLKPLPLEKRVVALMMRNDIESIIAYLAFLKRRYSILMIDAGLSKEKKEGILNAYRPNYVYDRKVINYNSADLKIYKELALLLPTSGSTGSSKYVRLSYKNLQANCDSILKYLPITKEDIAITSLPLYYSYGLSVLHTHLQKGAALVVTELSLIQKEFWELVRKYKVTNFNGVPYHYEILAKLRFTLSDYPHLKFLTQAGGRLHKGLVYSFAKDAIENKKRFYVMYGQTEATARISYLPPDKALLKPSSVGIAIPDTKLDIKNCKEPYKEGEIVFYGNNVMLGYALNYKDFIKDDELHGKLNTGDIGYYDEDNFFYITGRAKRFVKVFGERVNLDEIEQSLKICFGDIVVTGEDNKVIIWSKKNLEKDILKFLKDNYRFHKKVFKFNTVEEFFYKPNGKIDYEKFKE